MALTRKQVGERRRAKIKRLGLCVACGLGNDNKPFTYCTTCTKKRKVRFMEIPMAEFPKTSEALYAAGYRFKNNSFCNGIKCAAPIQWWRTPSGKSIPLNHSTLEPHWATCLAVSQYRKRYIGQTK